MSLWSRLSNVFRGGDLNRDIDEELELHIAEAVAQGRDPGEARRALGSPLRHREASRDIRMMAWLDSLRADAIFGWRQLKKRKATSAAAIISLAVAIGACTSAFRLIDAMLLRPLPVAGAERMYVAAREGFGPSGNLRVSESWEYPLFRRMRAAVKDSAEMIAISYADRTDLTFGSDEEMEKANRQFVSGWMFRAFGLRPAAGRLLTEDDDRTPGAHPYAVISHDYWTRRFGRASNVVGRSFRMGNDVYEVVGVVAEGFTGTEPGTFIDVFVPTMMNAYVGRSDASWFRALAILKPGVTAEPLRAKLHGISRAFQEEQARGWTGISKQFRERILNQKLVLAPAESGVSGTQTAYRRPLIVLGVLVTLVLLIACANVANLMTAQATARSREMALRVSIGAGRQRLIQMVLVESAWLGLLGAAGGYIFAAWAAPFLVGRINGPDNPARVTLPLDWRVAAFSLALALGVTCLFGLATAFRVSSVRPASAIKGGDQPHAPRRLMHALIAIQVAFCFIVYFTAGLFVATLDRIANQSTGFSSERLLVLETTARTGQPPQVWDQVLDHLRNVPGVESVALAGWPLLSGNGWNGFVWINGVPTEVLAYYLGVSPGWTETMGIRLLDGRDLRQGEVYPNAAIVNEAFARQCLGGGNPIGRWFAKKAGDGATEDRFQVVGLVGNARYRNMREPITPTAYVPFHSLDAKGEWRPKTSGTFIVRTANMNPAALATLLRGEVSRARPELRVSNLRTQEEVNQQHTVRERLLAMLGLFFAMAALLLSGTGLYGVLAYSVVQRRRELGIRIAIGASAGDIAHRVTAGVLAMVAVGTVAGVAMGMASAQYIDALLYQVKPTGLGAIALPAATVLLATFAAALPAVYQAIRIDPATMLRTE